jgi:hypothetical protein
MQDKLTTAYGVESNNNVITFSTVNYVHNKIYHFRGMWVNYYQTSQCQIPGDGTVVTVVRMSDVAI